MVFLGVHGVEYLEGVPGVPQLWDVRVAVRGRHLHPVILVVVTHHLLDFCHLKWKISRSEEFHLSDSLDKIFTDSSEVRFNLHEVRLNPTSEKWNFEFSEFFNVQSDLVCV